MPESYAPKRVVSLQPSVTITLRDLGLLHKLVACTRYCADICPEVKQAGCLIVEDSWSAKAEEFLAAKPDLVISSVPYRMESVAEIIKSGVPFLGLSPRSLFDVYQDIMMIARTVASYEPGEAEKRGLDLVQRMQQEIATVRQKTSTMGRPLVYCEEWGKPLILSQPWVAELVEAAGGTFFGPPGKQTTDQEVVAADPEVMVAAWCGAGDRVPLEKIIARRRWENIRAAKNGRVYCINDEFLNTPASTLLLGLYALMAAIHPETSAESPGLRKIDSMALKRRGTEEEVEQTIRMGNASN